MSNYISLFFYEIYTLFIDMAPYLLLGVSVAGLLSVFIKKELVVSQIGDHSFASIIKSALLGVPLPLCSCGVIPTVSYLKKYGASKPATMSFLISTPQTGVDSLVATWGMLGPLFAVFRAMTALITGIIGGAISYLFDKEENINSDNSTNTAMINAHTSIKEKWQHFINFSYRESIDDIAVNFIIGIVLAALISLFIPDNFFVGTGFDNGFFSMLLMIIIGIPMYVCSTSSIPIAVALILKGFSPGAAYVFLVAGPATNIATLAILLRVVGKKQTSIYLGTIIVGSLIFGLLMDGITSATGWTFTGAIVDTHEHYSILSYLCAIFFALLLGISLYKRYLPSKTDSNCSANSCACSPANTRLEIEHSVILPIEGMNCHHCSSAVSDALQSVSGVTSVNVDLKNKQASITGTATLDKLKQAVIKAGYKA